MFALLAAFLFLLGCPAAASAAESIIVDHHAIAEFDQIPDYWLEQAKQRTVHFGHTSHGSQIIAGANYLRDHVDPAKYGFSVRGREDGVGLPPAQDPPVLRMWEQGSWPYDYWSTRDGKDATRATLATGLFDTSGWAWCGQVANCAPDLECQDDQYISDYLDALNDLEQEFPAVRIFYMTGHAVEQGAVGNNDDRLLRNNQRIRDFAMLNGKVLFDFADIERWDPNGNDHLLDDDDSCQWCYAWCEGHPNRCSNLPQNDWDGACGDDDCRGCAHSHGLNCLNKAKAFWWMMARLAGWDGVTSGGESVCEDGVDNDGDSLVDYPDDPGCFNRDANIEDATCQDGHDNDGDGKIDFDGALSALGYVKTAPDPECESTPWRHTESGLTLTGGQQACVNQMNKNGAKVNKAQLKEQETCLKDYQKGKLEIAFEECIAADRNGKVQKAKDKTVSAEDKKCGLLAELPPFAHRDSTIVGEAAVEGALALSHDIFGRPVGDADLMTTAERKETARCQLEVLKQVQKLESTVLKEIVKAKKSALKEETVDSALALAAELEAAFSSDKIAEAGEKLVKGIEKKCGALPDPEVIFPGDCADPEWGEVEDCAIAVARCRACLMINSFSALELDCEDLDDGDSNGSCL